MNCRDNTTNLSGEGLYTTLDGELKTTVLCGDGAIEGLPLEDFFMLQETGDFLLLETGDKIIL